MLAPINSLFNRYFMSDFFESSYKTYTKEKDDSFIIEVALPGMKKEDIKINTKDRVLTISAEQDSESSARQVSYNQSFRLPETLDTENISATYEQGILSIKLPKKAKPKSDAKEVKIQ